jgi:hypothetical protein
MTIEKWLRIKSWVDMKALADSAIGGSSDQKGYPVLDNEAGNWSCNCHREVFIMFDEEFEGE